MFIIDAIKSSVEICYLGKITSLRPDCSKQALGYFLMQNHCTCNSRLLNCCNIKWKVTLAYFMFLNRAEKHYVVIEGEWLAIAWLMKHMKYCTKGCKNRVVITNHKPLVKIFGDYVLNEIQHTCIFMLKQHTLPWFFEVHYLAGKPNLVAYATFYYPHLLSKSN